MAKDDNAQIEFIIQFLRDGIERKDILPKFTEIYRTSEKTFNSRLKIARERYADENKAKEIIKEGLLPELLKAEIEAQIATESEIDLVLSKIVMGGCLVEEFIKGTAVLRTAEPMEIIAAADKLYKRKSSYAALKVAETDKDGNDKRTLNDNQFETLLNAVTSGKAK